jgi:hypothetical protein
MDIGAAVAYKADKPLPVEQFALGNFFMLRAL